MDNYGKIKEVWLILECPHCQRPNVKNKFVDLYKVQPLEKPFQMQCPVCHKTYTVDTRILYEGGLDTR